MAIRPVISYSNFKDEICEALEDNKLLNRTNENLIDAEKQYRELVGAVARKYKNEIFGPRIEGGADRRWQLWLAEIQNEFGEVWATIQHITQDKVYSLAGGTSAREHAHAIHFRLHADLEHPKYAKEIDEHIFGGSFASKFDCAVFETVRDEEYHTAEDGQPIQNEALCRNNVQEIFQLEPPSAHQMSKDFEFELLVDGRCDYTTREYQNYLIIKCGFEKVNLSADIHNIDLQSINSSGFGVEKWISRRNSGVSWVIDSTYSGPPKPTLQGRALGELPLLRGKLADPLKYSEINITALVEYPDFVVTAHTKSGQKADIDANKEEEIRSDMIKLLLIARCKQNNFNCEISYGSISWNSDQKYIQNNNQDPLKYLNPRDIENIKIWMKSDNPNIKDVFDALTGELTSESERLEIESIINDLEVGDISIHRSAIESIDIELPKEELIERISSAKHKKVALYRGDKDSIVGIIRRNGFLANIQRARGDDVQFNISEYMIQPWFVPDTTTVIDQTRAFLRRKTDFSIVVDEYGEIEGLLTLSDILDKLAPSTSPAALKKMGIVKIDDTSCTVDGRVAIPTLNQVFGWKISDNDANTIGGYVIFNLKRIPKQGHVFDISDKIYEVLEATETRIVRMKISENLQSSVKNQ